MIDIGIDARLYTQTGVGRYLQNLIRVLKKLDKENTYTVYMRSEEFDMVSLDHPRWKKVALDIPWHGIREQIHLPGMFSQARHDVMHFPYFNIPIGYRGRYLLTVHDLIIDHFNTGRASTLPTFLYKLKRMAYQLGMWQGIARASAITVISQTTKHELLHHYHPMEEKVFVTYDALDEHFEDVVSSHRPKRQVKDRYILYVGNAYPHKNLEVLMHAMKKVLQKEKIFLILAGNDGFFYPRLEEESRKMGLSDYVKFLGMADDSKLVDLYTYAEALVFPSLMEGFGLPTFEAIRCGCLPILSDIPVFHELWGDTLTYFNPKKPDEIAHVIIDALQTPSIVRAKKVKQAMSIVSKYTWKDTAIKTMSLYKQIAQK